MSYTYSSGSQSSAIHPDFGIFQGLQTINIRQVLNQTPLDTVQSSASSGATQTNQVPASTSSSIVPGVSAPSPAACPEDAARRKELRAIKSRDTAREYRRKRKDYVQCLEDRLARLKNQMVELQERKLTLTEELNALRATII